MNLHYVMVAGQPAQVMNNAFLPGMPSFDGVYRAPDTFIQSTGPIYYAWKNEGMRQALGYAISDEVEYPGMLQRSNDIVYLTASSGHIYRVTSSAPWGVIIPPSR
jgi:hypothetical protein